MIITDRLSIYPANEAEMVSFIAGIEDENLRQAYQQMLDGCLQNPHQWEWYAIWMIELKDGTHIGELCFKGIDENGITEIGYGISADYQGQGYATEAVAAVTDWALARSGVTCITAETEESNVASHRVLSKAGFIPTGETGEEGPLYIRKKRRMETGRILLREWRESDAEVLFKYASDPDVGPRAGWPPHKSVEESRGVIRDIFSNDRTWAIELKETGEAIGCMGYFLYGESNIGIGEKDAEIGYWVARPYWNQGICTEALRLMIDYSFNVKGFECLWSDFFVDNPASGHVMEKCGFRDTGKFCFCSKLYGGNERPVHIMKLDYAFSIEQSKVKMKDTAQYQIIRLADRPELKDCVAQWFSEKWSISKEAYLESIEESFKSVVPSWYVCLDGEEIIAGMGVIDNDFHDRKDLAPNVCAVFTEEGYRCRGIAGRLLDFVCGDMASKGILTLYLLTDHTGFYERYGWEFCCLAMGDGEDKPSRIYIHRQK